MPEYTLSDKSDTFRTKNRSDAIEWIRCLLTQNVPPYHDVSTIIFCLESERFST